MRPAPGQVEDALAYLGCQAEVLSLDPHSLDDVLDSILAVGQRTGVSGRAARLVAELRARLAGTAAAVGSPEVVIFLAAVSEPCWADLATPGGATIFQGILDPGTSKTWTERRAVTLELGNPSAVTLTVDGKGRTGLGSAPVTLRLAPGQRTSG